MATFRPRTRTPLPPSPEGWFDVRYAITSAGDLACIRATADVNANWEFNRGLWQQHPELPMGARAQRPLFGPATLARLQVIAGAGDRRICEFPLTYPWPKFDRFSDGGWIVAAARSELDEANATHWSATGAALARFPIGDGIEHLQCDADDNIWVGYFDEGIFGDSIGQAGLARFDTHGAKTWSYNRMEAMEHPIDDCYALNVASGEVWSCFYSDFPLLRVSAHDGAQRLWRNGVTGAKALAVDGSEAVLFGGYRDNKNRIAYLTLSDYGEWRGTLTLDHEDLERQRVFGRGDTLHVVTETEWLSFTVAEVRAAVEAAGKDAEPDYDDEV